MTIYRIRSIGFLLFALLYCFSPAFASTPVYQVTTKQPWNGNCDRNAYTAANTFAPTDEAMRAYFEIDNVSSTDIVSVQWIQPNNSAFSSDVWGSGAGNRCYMDWVPIAGAAAASLPGTWHAKGLVNGIQIFDLVVTLGGNPIQPRGANYIGSFDPIPTDCSHLYGWALDANTPSLTISVDILKDGSYLGSASANQPRSDLTGDLANHAWNFFNVPPLIDGQTHTIKVVYSGTSQEVPGSSRQFPPSGAQASSCSPGAPSNPPSVWIYSGRTDSRLDGFIVRLEKEHLSGSDYQYRFFIVNDSGYSFSRLTKGLLVMVNRVGTYVYQDSYTSRIGWGSSDQILNNLTIGWEIPPTSGSSGAGQAAITLLSLLAYADDPAAAAVGQAAGVITDAQAVSGLFGQAANVWNYMSPSTTFLRNMVDQNSYTTRRYYIESSPQGNNAPDWGGIRFSINVREDGSDQPVFFLMTDNNTFNGILSLEIGTNRQSYIPGRLFPISR